MEVKIGVQMATRELVIESADDAEALQKQIAEAVADNGVLSLTDSKGRTVVVPASKLAYVEIGPSIHGNVGFRS